MPKLYAQQLGFQYAKQSILDKLNLCFKPAGFHVLLGENGAGKSTLLKLLAGLLSPSTGSVTYNGQAITQLPRQAWAKQCSFMPQHSPLSLDFSVRELVSMGRYPHQTRFAPLSQAEQQLIDQVLIQTDLEQLAQRPWNRLSGGEQQRVMIARSLVTQTQILLFDEPTASLDLRHRLAMLELFQQLGQQGRCVICSSHDLEFSSRYADRIILLHQGKIHAQGTATEVLTPDNLKQVFAVNATIYPQATGNYTKLFL